MFHPVRMCRSTMGFVLNQDDDLSQSGVQAVAHREIDDPILPPKGTAGLLDVVSG